MDPLFEIQIELVKGSREISKSLHRQLEAAITDGRLRAGTQLPPTRTAARLFGVSRSTTVEVYERLLNEGLVYAHHGSGTFVSDAVRRNPPENSKHPPLKLDGRLNPLWLTKEVTEAVGFWRERREASGRTTRAHRIDFRPALIDSRLFPLDMFRRVVTKQMRAMERRPARFRSPQGNQGNYHLRHAIANHIAQTRGVVCQAEHLIVTSGAQQAFDLLARVLVKPNKTVVAIEDPGYPPMRAAFAASGARIIPVEIDAEGLMLERLPADVAVICVCPSHQFPLGVAMSAQRRKALVEFARTRRAVIIEDDYDGEFRFDGSPLQALRAADPANVVCYVGTFSKCMLPTLRLGFIVAPSWALPALVTAKNCLDWHCPTILQLAVSAFIGEGHLSRHVRKMRTVYDQRRRLLLATLRRDFARWLEPIPSCYGMHVSAISPLDMASVAEALLESGVHIHTLARYYVKARPRSGLIFGFGACDLPEITRGLALLRKALAG